MSPIAVREPQLVQATVNSGSGVEEAIPRWQELCNIKQAERERSIPAEWRIPLNQFTTEKNLLSVPATCGILTGEEIKITSEFNAIELLEQIKSGKLSSEAVTIAFCKRAAIAQQLVNCLTEVFFDEAISRARDLDEERRLHPEWPLRPLHGLPISLKDSFKLKGKDSSIGLACFVGKPATANSTLVDQLLSLGAILYCKTNLGQLMLTADSDNNVFGRTLNPTHTDMTPGGSSGGEAALVALRGSILGIATDMGGSVRGPCSATGVYALKPSSGIIPYGNQQSAISPGIRVVQSSAGIVATSMRDCQFLLRTIMDTEPWKRDVTCLHIPWTWKYQQPKALRIGIIMDDGCFTPTPPIRRALKESIEKLEKSGHLAIPITENLDIGRLQQLVYATFPLDGFESYRGAIEETGEPLVPSMKKIGLPNIPHRTLEDLVRFSITQFAARIAWHKIWRALQLDAILMPVAPHTAVPKDTWRVLNYTGLFNFLDYPACTIPVGHVDERDVPDNEAKYGAMDAGVYETYTGPEAYKSVPICLQLVGEGQNDEEFANVAVQIDSVLNPTRTGASKGNLYI